MNGNEPENPHQGRMQHLVDQFMSAVDDDMKANGPMDPNALILTMGAFVAGTIEALEARTSVHRDTVLRIYMGTLLNLMLEPATPPAPPGEKPN